MFVIFAVIAIALMVGVDQVTKYLVLEYLSDNHERTDKFVTVVEDVLRFRFEPNTGGVFGFFAEHTVALTIVSIILLIGAVYILATNKSRSRLVNICIVMMIAGGIGNVIDRIRLGFVVDFIEPTFINFAVFNVADCFITVSAFLLIGYLIYDFIKDVKKNRISTADGKNQKSEAPTVTEDADGAK